MAGSIVVLERADGRRMTVSQSALSPEDMAYLDGIGAERDTVPKPDARLNTPPWREITRTFTGGDRKPAGIVVKNQRTTSADSYSVPLEIEYVCMTDFSNIRLVYACKQLIFNWEVNRNELRIDGGPAGGQHRPGAGAVPIGRFVTIRQRVEEDKMSVFVDDKPRASWKADFSAVNSRISVFTGFGSTVTIKSVKIRELLR